MLPIITLEDNELRDLQVFEKTEIWFSLKFNKMESSFWLSKAG